MTIENDSIPRIGRDLTPEERTMQLLTENAAVRDRAAFNYWHATYQTRASAYFASEYWRSMKREVRETYAKEMLESLRVYHAMSPAERDLHNRGALKTLLDRNETAAPSVSRPEAGPDE